MVNIEDSVIARMKVKNEIFEIRVDPELALDFKAGKSVSLREVLVIDRIFSDVRKATEASGQKLKDAFGTNNVEDVASQILHKGEIQVTAKHRDMLRDIKVKQVINLIHRNAIDPKTGAPHPVTRIEAALEQAKVKIDENRDAESQIQDIIKKLLPIIPIKFEIDEIQVTIPSKYSAKSIGAVRKLGTVHKEQWLEDGSWQCIIEVPAGMKEELFERLNDLTKGEVDTKIIRTR